MYQRHEARPPRALLLLVVLMGVSGCASGAPSSLSEDGGGLGPWQQRDGFQLLQQAAGLEEDSWHEAGEELETDDAQALWAALAGTRTTLLTFAPRRCLMFLRSSHLKNSVEYNRQWAELFKSNPTVEQILQYGRYLGGKYGFQVHF